MSFEHDNSKPPAEYMMFVIPFKDGYAKLGRKLGNAKYMGTILAYPNRREYKNMTG